LKIWKIGGLFYYFRFAEKVPAIESANNIRQNFAVAGNFILFFYFFWNLTIDKNMGFERKKKKKIILFFQT
jgi:hypothetical protein